MEGECSICTCSGLPESLIRTIQYDVTHLFWALPLIAASLLTPRAMRELQGRFAVWGIPVRAGLFVLGTGDYALEVKEYVLRVGQILVIFWAGANLMRDERTARMALYALLACVGLAVMQLTGIASASADLGGGIRRGMTVLGQNPESNGAAPRRRSTGPDRLGTWPPYSGFSGASDDLACRRNARLRHGAGRPARGVAVALPGPEYHLAGSVQLPTKIGSVVSGRRSSSRWLAGWRCGVAAMRKT